MPMFTGLDPFVLLGLQVGRCQCQSVTKQDIKQGFIFLLDSETVFEIGFGVLEAIVRLIVIERFINK